MNTSYTLNNFLELIHGLKNHVEFYEIKNTNSALLFYFTYNHNEYGVWFTQDWLEVGLKNQNGTIINIQDFIYDNDNNYLGETEYNTKLIVEQFFNHKDYEIFLRQLEKCIANWLFIQQT